MLARKQVHSESRFRDGPGRIGPNNSGSIGEIVAHCCLASLSVQSRMDFVFILRPMPNSAVPLLRIERGEVEEGIQRGHLAAVDAVGTLVASQGDASRLTYFRSCAKPFQAIAALPTAIVEHFWLSPEHVAIIC